jgi:hypothetical protein
MIMLEDGVKIAAPEEAVRVRDIAEVWKAATE